MRSLAVNPLVYTAPAFIVFPEVQDPLLYWISVAPQIGQYVAFINDLLSFPKEIRAGEEWNYLSMTSRARRQAGEPSRFSQRVLLLVILCGPSGIRCTRQSRTH
ncbi:hypothetical protein ASPWEDRAFT_40558 [Aspergillus wentii DTO 134E9]|uniref:Uncharacterized protein n=1 Tax=Aspergillus wentii DTO 134E9 TaxID=1073089 RepID=A0A1L9RK91_ASPWE|nr:uncharacterized protein ASPWEDRAFT_40558 [Aspergillus wentii DTO 134E9]OJJ35350.1 hypothetical protein ASPWEDRAFT_40558 [Aspergillus wentii DTO 134E9]